MTLGKVAKEFLLEGFSKERTRLLRGKTSMPHVHERLGNNFGTLGLLAMLMMGVTVNYGVYLKAHRAYFVAKGHTSSWYFVYAGLLMTSFVIQFIAIISSVANYVMLNFICDTKLERYVQKAGRILQLPVLALMNGIVVQLCAMSVLMYYMVGTVFGTCFLLSGASAVIFVSYIVFALKDAGNNAYEQITPRPSPRDHSQSSQSPRTHSTPRESLHKHSTMPDLGAADNA